MQVHKGKARKEARRCALARVHAPQPIRAASMAAVSIFHGRAAPVFPWQTMMASGSALGRSCGAWVGRLPNVEPLLSLGSF